MKNLVRPISLLLASLVLSFAVSAELYAKDINILEEYYALDEWNGNDMYYDNKSGAVFFIYRTEPREGDSTEFPSTSKEQSASVTIDLPDEKAEGFFFSADIGNGAEETDYGSAELVFFDSNNNELLKAQSGNITGQANYHRYSIGTAEKFAAVPYQADKVRLTLSAVSTDDDYMIDVFFRNMYLMFSDEYETKEILLNNMTLDESGDLSAVSIGTNEFQHWLWVGAIFCVAIIFFVIRTARERIRKN